ncbi:MAG: hypothetical protein U0Z53_09845 [Blastocatellia bacterium]
MSKARLVKKEDIRPEMLQKRKSNRSRKSQKQPVRTAVEVTREWISKQRNERPGAREAFEALFAKAEPQSA